MKRLKPMIFFVLSSLCTPIQAPGQGGKIDSLKQALTKATGKEQIKYLNELASVMLDTNPKEAIRYGEEAVSLSQALGYQPGLIAGYENIGMAYRGDYGKKVEFLSKALMVADRSHDLEASVRISLNIARTYSVPNNYEKSLEYYLRSLELNRTLQNKKLQARAFSGIAWIYKNTGKYKMAVENFKKAISLQEELKEKTIAWTYMGLASAYMEMNDNTSQKYFDLAYATFQLQGDKSGMAVVLYKTGEVHLRKKSWATAESYLNQSLALSRSIHQRAFMAIALKLLGQVSQNKNEDEKALAYYLEAEPLARQLRMQEELRELYKNIAILYKKKKDFKEALINHELYIIYQDSLFSREKNKQITEMQYRFETQNKETEIELLKKDRVINQTYLASVSTGLLLVMIIGILIINFQRMKSKNDREQKFLMEAELQNKRLRETYLEKELDFKNKELTTFTLNLIQKNEMLENLKAQIISIRNASDDITKTRLSSLLSTVNFSFHLDKDWDNFKLHFQQVHKDFIENLGRAYPDLSSNDLKVCAMLKLNIGTKEMSTILDISPESVKSARYRIRKKISLPSDQSLSSFFNNFSY